MKTTNASFALIALLGAGCGPSMDEPATAAGQIDGASLSSTYQSWSYTSCADAAPCGETFRAKVGGPATVNPRAGGTNPDAEWLTGWERLPSPSNDAPRVYEAIALAATHRSFDEACNAAYANYDKDLSKRLADATAVIARATTDPNPYTRLSALLALVPSATPTPGEFTPGTDPVRYQIEAELFDAFEATNRGFVYRVNHYLPAEDLFTAMHKREPRAYERDAFCLAASRGQIPNFAKLPSPPSGESFDDIVRPVFTAQRIAELDGRRKDLTDLTRAKFAKAKTEGTGLPPGVRELNEGKVTRFERSGPGASVTFSSAGEKNDGTKIQKIDETVTATFTEWPPGLLLDVGDSISFYGVEKKTKDTVIQSSPKLEHLSRETTIEGKHVTRAVAKGKTTVFLPPRK